MCNRLINFEADYWADAVRAEGQLRAEAWEAEKKRIKKEIAGTEAEIRLVVLERARKRAKLSEAQLKSLREKESSLKTRLATLQSSLPKTRALHEKNLNGAFNASLVVRNNIADLCGKLSNNMGLLNGSIMESKMRGLYFVTSLSGAYSGPTPTLDVWVPRNSGGTTLPTDGDAGSFLEGGRSGGGAVDVLEGRKNR